MTNTTPGTATEASLQRLELARELTRFCPPELGRAIALTGSAARGVADSASDIELNFWVDEPLDGGAQSAWLRQAGATDIVLDAAPIEDGSLWVTCRYKGVWIEAGWQRVEALDATLHELLLGQITDHDRLIHAWIVLHAMLLRDTGFLAGWQAALQHYPTVLPVRLIAVATELWTLPHVVEMRWTLARRSDRLALAERLVSEAHDVLRILFALNNQWEPYWKWVRQAVAGLTIKLDRLNERIDEIFSTSPDARSVARLLELVRDTLALVPPSIDVARARQVIDESLRRHAP